MMDKKSIIVQDERFSFENIHNFDLVFELKESQFRFCLIENNSNTIYWLEDYYIEPQVEIKTQLDQIFKNHIFLKAQFWNSINISLKAENYSLVPIELFQETNLEDYLIKKTNKKDFYTDFKHLSDLKLVLVYALNQEILTYFTSIYDQKGIYIISDIEVYLKSTNFEENNISFWFDKHTVLFSLNSANGFEGLFRLPLKKEVIEKFFNLYINKGKSIRDFRAFFSER